MDAVVICFSVPGFFPLANRHCRGCLLRVFSNQSPFGILRTSMVLVSRVVSAGTYGPGQHSAARRVADCSPSRSLFDTSKTFTLFAGVFFTVRAGSGSVHNRGIAALRTQPIAARPEYFMVAPWKVTLAAMACPVAVIV